LKVTNANLPTTVTGYTPNIYPPGAAIFWLPMFFIVDMVAQIIHNIIPHYPNNGYSDIYQITIGITNATIGLLALIIVYALLRSFYSKTLSCITLLCLFLGSNLFYYLSIDVINSHPTSFLVASIFSIYYFKSHKSKNTIRY